MKPDDGRKANGGARWRTGPKVRRVQLDNDTTDMLRTLAKEYRLINPAVSEADAVNTIVNNLVRAAWAESDAAYQQAD